MSSASCRPSSSLGGGGASPCLPSRARSKPSSTQRRRTFSTVVVRQRQVLAISASIQASGPSTSASSRMWARRAFWLAALSRFRVSSHSVRSSSVSRTIYLFAGMGGSSLEADLLTQPPTNIIA